LTIPRCATTVVVQRNCHASQGGDARAQNGLRSHRGSVKLANGTQPHVTPSSPEQNPQNDTATRSLLAAALDGSLKAADFRTDATFGFDLPVAVAGVDSAILDPRSTRADKVAYDLQAARLVGMFAVNFQKFEPSRRCHCPRRRSAPARSCGIVGVTRSLAPRGRAGVL